jgi:Transmembrane secretion effector
VTGSSLLRHRGVRALVAAETISMAGSQMTYVVLPWFVLITTGSPAQMSVVVAAEMLPVALFGLASGAVTARIGARRTMLISRRRGRRASGGDPVAPSGGDGDLGHRGPPRSAAS